mgnify:FL=1
MESKEDACCGGNLMGITGVNNNFQTYGYTDQFNMGKPGVSDDMPNGMKPNADAVDGKDGETGKNDATRKGADSVEEKDGRKKECQTCKNRKYIDGSDEANVSFKNAAHASPEAAGAAVRAHEGQHVSNAYSKASEKDGKVIFASVRIHTAICPECGRSYVSGGVTDTQIKYYNESNPYQQDLKATDGMKARGERVDLGV